MMSDDLKAHLSAEKAPYRYMIWRLMLILIPVGVASWLSWFAVGVEEQYRRSNIQKTFEREIHEFIQASRPQPFFAGKLRKTAWTMLQTDAGERDVWESLRQSWPAEWRDALELFRFDERHSLVQSFSRRGMEPFIRKFWKNLHRARLDPEKVSADDRRETNYTFGLDFHLEKIAHLPGTVFAIRHQGADGFGLWMRSRKTRRGVLLMFWKAPGSAEIFRFHQKLNGRTWTILLADAAGEWETIADPHGIQADFSEARNRLLFSREKAWFQKDRVWAAVPVHHSYLLVSRREHGHDFVAVKGAVIGIFMLLTIGVLHFGYQHFVLRRRLYVSIRRKLVLLFVFAIFIPLLELVFLGVRTLRDREEVLVENAHKAARETLVDLDAQFVGERNKSRQWFAALRDDPRVNRDLPALRRFAETLRARKILSRLEIRGVGGETITLIEDESLTERVSSLFDAFGKFCIESHLGERRRNTPLKASSQADTVMRMVVESPEMGFVYLVDRPARMHEIKFGTLHTWLCWDVYREETGSAAYMMVLQQVKSVQDLFLRRHLKRGRKHHEQFHIFACNGPADTWYPRGVVPSRTMKALREKVLVTGKPVTGQILIRGESFLATAIPGCNLEDHFLVALSSEAEVLQGLAAIKAMIILGVLLAIVLAILTGIVLADTFLTPIQDLTAGVQAMTERNVSYRIPKHSKDEFGDLAEMFNRMITELKEMELAKVVQEALIPSAVPSLAGYEIETFIRTASDLGGDYFDVVPMEDGKLLVVIGDVTGHGVSSALLVAMAKAVVFQFSAKGGRVIDLMKRLNHLILSLLHRRKMMTFFAALLDPASGKLICANAGHPFPLVCSATGEVRKLEIARYPLGATTRKTAFEEVEVQLVDGDVLVLYTDGLVESTNVRGEAFGYQKLEDLVSRCPQGSPGELRKTLWDAFLAHAATPKLEDDITLVILKKTGEIQVAKTIFPA
jgi:HAMP domain-containing protein